MAEQSGEKAWSVEAENGVRCYTSQDIAEEVAAGYSSYTLGVDGSPVVRAYVRAHADAEWEPLTPPGTGRQ